VPLVAQVPPVLPAPLVLLGPLEVAVLLRRQAPRTIHKDHLAVFKD
jgi:hypothetical protein